MDIAVIDHDRLSRTSLASWLQSFGHRVSEHEDFQPASSHAAAGRFDLAFVDAQMILGNRGRLIRRSRSSPVTVATSTCIDLVSKAIDHGASDYLLKPFSDAHVRLVTSRAGQLRQLNRITADTPIEADADFSTCNPEMARALHLARHVAPTNATVLITGELGTGKTRLAAAIHNWSGRSHSELAAFSCYSGTCDGIDAALFGSSASDSDHGSVEAPGQIESCAGGTLHLQEVGRLPMSLQPKMLRLLREREYDRHNDTTIQKTSARIIATSSVDLCRAARAGRFRDDLLQTLQVITIHLPALRERHQDIVPLAHRYLDCFARSNRKTHRAIFQNAPSLPWVVTAWPGNVLELRNVIERAVLLCEQDEIGIEHLPAEVSTAPARHTVGDRVALQTIQDLHIQRIVQNAPTLAAAASILGIHTATLIRKMKRLRDSNLPDAYPATL